MDFRTRTISLFLFLFAMGGSLQAHIASNCDGGTVATEAGADTAYYCINGSGGVGSVISFDSTTNATDNYAYVVTDPNGIILGLPPADMVDFAPAGVGECWVWGLSYTGNLTVSTGDNAATATLSSGCYDLSDNYVVVYRDDVDGGMVYNADGGDTSYVCIDGSSQVVSFMHMNNAGPNFRYVVTDPQGNILGLPPGNSVDFAPAGVGECWVWGLGYSGEVTAQLGDNALTTALTDGCYDLSDNFLVVLRDDVDGGTVYNAAGTDTSYVCIDGSSQVVSFTHMGNSGPNFRYVVTDAQGNILGLPPGNSVDFAPAGVGECWVWGLGYSGEVTAQLGDNALTAALTDGCFDLSDNFLVVLRDSVSGGMVYNAAGTDTSYVCIDGSSQVVSFTHMGDVGPNFRYVVTDAQGTILGLPPGNSVDFAPAGVGECWVWGLGYSGDVTAQLGDNALTTALTDGCFDLSDNFLVVLRDSVSGGLVYNAAGTDTSYVCIDGSSQVVNFTHMGNEGPNFRYVVTDAQGTILGLPPGNSVDFAPAGVGECWVWGLGYSGDVTAQLGDNALTTALTDGCFDLSDNFLVVLRDTVSGGMVYNADGGDTSYVCIDGSAQVVSFTHMGNEGPNFRYVVTDAQGTILGLPPGNSVDFAPAGVGECWVWGLGYSGDVTAQLGDNALTTALTDGCFDLSDNFLVVLRDDVDGGMVYNADGGDTSYVCIDGSAQVVSFTHMNNSGPNFRYVVTDPQGTILGLPPGNSVDFAPAGVGECWVWGLGYSGDVTAQVGDNALTTALTDGCFDLSDNFLVVLRDDVDGGMVYNADGNDTSIVCIDGSAQVVSFTHMGNTGPNFRYVVTDDQGTILGLPPGNSVDFGPAGVGECWVWGLGYSGTVTAQVGDNALTTPLTDGCFDLSSNFLVVLRNGPELSLKYKNSENGPNAINNKSIKPQIRVMNSGCAPADLSKITMRYWFTEDVSGTYTATCKSSDAGCGNTTLTLGSLNPDLTGADSYLEVGFTSGTLAPGARVNTNTIIRRKDGNSFDESDDHSFIGIITNHVYNDNITLYYDGVLITGTEPAPLPPTSPLQSPTTIANFQSLQANIFPNPFTSSLKIEWNEAPSQAYDIRIMNINGQEVFRAEGSAISEDISLPNIPAGMYLIQLRTDSQVISKRIMKR